MLSSPAANKIVRSAINLLDISLKYGLSKATISIIEKLLQRNGVATGGAKKRGGAKKCKMYGGSKPSEVTLLENNAISLLKIALAYDLSKSVLNELKKLLEKNGEK